MPSDVMKTWLRSRRYAWINNEYLKPVKHPVIKDTPLSIRCGQAEVFFLKSKNGDPKILKVFYSNKLPGESYLRAISSVLPKQKAFICGLERQVLSSSSLNSHQGYHTKALSNFLDNAVLMPQVPGQDWMSLIDEIRGKTVHLSDKQRRLIAFNLAAVTKAMEAGSISHRDYSTGNIYIDFNNQSCQIYLIDLDCPYHPSLHMPANTTIGSDGYMAPFIDLNDASSTYCCMADRFALTVLCVEFLILNPISPLVHEGGIFEQKELFQRYGNTVSYARSELKRTCPEALDLFKRALTSHSFADCPSPDEWMVLCHVPGCCLTIAKTLMKGLTNDTIRTFSWCTYIRNTVYVHPYRPSGISHVWKDRQYPCIRMRLNALHYKPCGYSIRAYGKRIDHRAYQANANSQK